MSVNVAANISFDNPTNYSANVPFVSLNVLVNGSQIGLAQARDVSVGPGYNKDVQVSAAYSAPSFGSDAAAVGKEFISQWLSGKQRSVQTDKLISAGYNTSFSLKAHEGFIPGDPALGRALERFELNFSTPHFSVPNDPDDPDDPDDGDSRSPHFIKRATMHLLSSTAVFNLISPFRTTTLYVSQINATAYYKGDPVALIIDEDELEVPPGESETPWIPVDWSLDSVGFDAVKNAIGGTLKMATRATLTVRIGQFSQDLWYIGRAIGTHVRF